MGRDSGETVYYSDLAARYGVEFHPEALSDAGSACFVEMAEHLLADLQPLPGPISLIVIGNTAPDLDIGRFVGCALSEANAGAAMFGVTDAGAATPFTALRAASAYAETSGHTLVLLLDQRVLPYDAVIEPTLEVTSDAGIALLFGPAGAGRGLSVRQYADVAPEDASSIASAALQEADGVDVVILGSGLAPDGHLHGMDHFRPDQQVVVEPSGRPTCGQWWAWFDTVGARAHRAAFADYDAGDRSVSVAVVDVDLDADEAAA